MVLKGISYTHKALVGMKYALMERRGKLSEGGGWRERGTLSERNSWGVLLASDNGPRELGKFCIFASSLAHCFHFMNELPRTTHKAKRDVAGNLTSSRSSFVKKHRAGLKAGFEVILESEFSQVRVNKTIIFLILLSKFRYFAREPKLLFPTFK